LRNDVPIPPAAPVINMRGISSLVSCDRIAVVVRQ
jgi:hypothetical protein